MKLFKCQACGQSIYFENRFCGACGPAGQSAFWATDGRLTHETRLDNIGFTSAPVFTSPDHGWIGARVLTNDRPDPTDEVLITNDAGHTWTPIFTAH